MTPASPAAPDRGRLWRPLLALRGARRWELALIALHPLVLPLTTAWRLVEALRGLAPLGREPWSGFGRMSASRTLGGSWHRGYDLLLERYGRWGYAYEIGLGLPLGPNFYLTKFSVALYRHAECVVPWLGMVALVASQTIWIGPATDAGTVLLVIAIALASTVFYYAAFEALKYDALGWALAGLGYWALVAGHLWLFALVLLAIACLSVSVLIVQGALWALAALVLHGPLALLAFVPAALKLLTHMRFLARRQGWERFRALASGIGTIGAGARRRRLAASRGDLYLLALWAAFLAGFAVLASESPGAGKGPALLIGGAAVGLFALNQTLRRFADVQTLHVLVFAAFTTMAILQPLGWLHALYCLAVSPLPYVLGFVDGGRGPSTLWCVPRRRPYRLSPLRELAERFMLPVRGGDRVLFDFAYEPDAYPSFGGARAFKEYLHFLALERGATVVPDFHLVFQAFGGLFPLERLYADRSPTGLRAALAEIGGRFVLRLAATPEIGEDWRRAGFVVRTRLDLRDGEDQGLWGSECYPRATPCLLLLEAADLASAPASGGVLLERAPNRMRIGLGDDGRTILRFTYDPGWRAAGAVVRQAAGDFPWIEVVGRPGAEVDLVFDAFARDGASGGEAR